MSAFAVAIGAEADMDYCTAYSAFDPKRTSHPFYAPRALRRICPLMTQSGHRSSLNDFHRNRYDVPVLSLGGANEAARVHHNSWRCGCVAASRVRTETRACAAGRRANVLSRE